MPRDDSLADSYTGLTLKTLTDGYTPLIPNKTLPTPTSAAPDWIQRTELPFAFDSPSYEEPTLPLYEPQGEPYRASNVNEWQTMKQFGLGTLTGLDYATGAPARKFIAESAKGRDPFSAFIAGLSQYGKRPETAPTGKDIATDIGFSTMGFKEAAQKAGQDPDFYPDWSPAGIVGTGIDMADISPMAAMMMPAKRVFHGSPHLFKKFSIDKIGTGEGAQAFGHGLYMTDSKGIAEDYARRLSDWNLTASYSPKNSAEEYIIEMAENYKSEFGGMPDKKTLQDWLNSNRNEDFDYEWFATGETLDQDDVDKALDVIHKKFYSEDKTPMFYTAKIPEGEYLVWDKKLPYEDEKRLIDYATNKAKDWDLIQLMSDAPDGKEVYERLVDYTGSPQKASELLQDAGFKGTQYPAGSLSGVKNSKAKNYVLFSDEGLDIDEIKNLSTGNVERLGKGSALKVGKTPKSLKLLPEWDNNALTIDPTEMHPKDLKKISNRMRQRGYDIKGADDAREIITKKMLLGTKPKLTQDWADVVKEVYGLADNQTKNLDFGKGLSKKINKEFGLTDDWNETGYLTTDGKQLDFSGKNQGGLGGSRVRDHREIGAVLPAKFNKEYSDGMIAFMDAGNIRIDGNAGSINLHTYPTGAQQRKLAKFINEKDGEILLEIGDRALEREYPTGTRFHQILEDIEDFLK